MSAVLRKLVLCTYFAPSHLQCCVGLPLPVYQMSVVHRFRFRTKSPTTRCRAWSLKKASAALSSLGISRGWALPLGSRVGVPAGTGTGQGPDTRALANGPIFSQNGLELAEI